MNTQPKPKTAADAPARKEQAPRATKAPQHSPLPMAFQYTNLQFNDLPGWARDTILALEGKAKHAERLAEAMRGALAALNQPVQFSNGKGGAFSIIQGDCAVARDFLSAALAQWEEGQK